MQSVNIAVIVGNLTKDPELRTTQSGTSVCNLRVAVNSRVKRDGEWVDKPNYFDVTVWGAHGENCATYLAKGRPVAVQGRLDWREWESQSGERRQGVSIVADTVQFLSGGQNGSAPAQADGASSREQHPAAETSGSSDDDDLPF